MAKTIKPNLSSKIAEQLPDFIQSDYGKFVNFLEAYYEFLEQNDTRNMEKVRDLDYTLDMFIGKLKNELDYIGKNYSYVDERFILSHIKDIYLAKGSEASYKLMFKLLFNKEATIKYPGQYLLKPSDGKWRQAVSVLVKSATGSIFDIVGKEVNFIIGNNRYKFLISRVKQTSVSDIQEAFIETQTFTDIPVGTTLQFGDYTGIVEPTITNIKIAYGGKGFKIGQIYEIKTQLGSGSKIKIVEATAAGEVKKIQIIKYGYGYITDANFTISPVTVSYSERAPSLNAGHLELNSENVDSFLDYGTISKYDYAENDYVDNTYVGNVLREFYNASENNGSKIDGADLLINFKLGGKIRYPGYYESNDGFVSDSIYLQDSKYYQIFSYVVSIEEQLKNYRDYIRTYLHPAGMRMFAEYNITNNISVKASLQFILNVLRIALQDIINTSELSSKDVNKSLSDTFTNTDVTAYTLLRSLADTFAQTDASVITTQKVISDSFDVAEFAFVYNMAYARLLADSFTHTEVTNYDINKVLSDSFTHSDSKTYSLTKMLGVEDIDSGSGNLGDEQSVLGLFQFGAVDATPSSTPTDFITVDDSALSIVNSLVRLLFETFSASDLSTININKFLNDSLTQSDISSYSLQKFLGIEMIATAPSMLGTPSSRMGLMQTGSVGSLASESPVDYVIMSDIFSIVSEVIRSYADSFNVLEETLININKNVTDNLSLTSETLININKNVTDNFTTTFSLNKSFSKFISDNFNATSITTLNTTKYINDVVNAGDSDNTYEINYNSSNSTWYIHFGPGVGYSGLLGTNFAQFGTLVPGNI